MLVYIYTHTHILHKILHKISYVGTSLMVQLLRLCAPNAGGPGSIPGQGTRSRMLQLRAHILQLKILHVATKDPACLNKDPARGNKDPTCRN